MSISDELMWRYFELLSFRPMLEINKWHEETKSGLTNPRDIKIKLALEIVERFHSKIAALKAHEEFTARFQHGAIPENIETTTINIEAKEIPLSNLLKQAGLTTSTSEAIRLIKQNGVRIDGQKVEDYSMRVSKGTEHVYQVGKHRIARIKIT